MKRFIIALQAGLLLVGLTACNKKKEKYEPIGKDAVAQIAVVDEKGDPQAGIAVMIFDETGYESFQKNRKTRPLVSILTQSDGTVAYRLPYKQWFKNGSRQVAFVIMEMLDEENYHIWAMSRTVKAADEVKIRFTLDRTSTGPDDPGMKSDESENSGEDVKNEGKNEGLSGPGLTAETVGSPFEMYNQENGHTLFGNALSLDNDLRFDGDDRYTIADAGPVESLAGLRELTLDRAARRISAWPGHGYFLCKDISLIEFPSGKRALAVGAEYVRIRVAEWITRDEQPIGVKFNYAIDKLAGDGLPEWGKIFDVKLAGDRTITLPLPANGQDSECAPWGKTPLRISFAEDHVSLQITDPQAAVGKEYRFVIRTGARYTEAKLRIVE